jgi:TPR repeat protein
MERLGHTSRVCAAAAMLLLPGGIVGATPDPAYEAFESGHYLTAIKEAGKAAAKGDPAAHTLLGEIYSKGYGVPRDRKKAAQWYEKGAKLGDANAQLAFGLALSEGLGINQDKERAADMFEKAAAAGLPAAQYNLALILIDGRFRPLDVAGAAKWLEKAAAQGHAQAQYDLAGMYARGTGVPLDDARAAELLESAARLGHSSAQVEFAMVGVSPKMRSRPSSCSRAPRKKGTRWRKTVLRASTRTGPAHRKIR